VDDAGVGATRAVAIEGVRTEDLRRIEVALEVAATVAGNFTSGRIDAAMKHGDDPVTAADLAIDAALHEELLGEGEGWLSEETVDDPDRLARSRVWVVDPIDGTREFVAGIPEWCISIGLVVDGHPVAGGILNPATGERILGGIGVGVDYRGDRPPAVAAGLAGALVLGSRSEVRRGEWERFSQGPFRLVPMGSVAFKLGLVAAGRADATWTLVPKNEWDLAAGVALVLASGGTVVRPDGQSLVFNQPSTLFPGLVACRAPLTEDVASLLGLGSALGMHE